MFAQSDTQRAREEQDETFISGHASNLASGLCVRSMERRSEPMDATALWEER
jgi:hypothetical protein